MRRTPSRRLGGKERLKQLVLDLGRNPGAVVANPDFHSLAKLARRHLQCRSEARRGALVWPLSGGVEPVADQVEQHAGHLLRCQLDRGDAWVEVAFQSDVETRVLRAGAP